MSNPVPRSDEVVQLEPGRDRYAGPPGGRQRVTVTRQLTAEIVEYYRQGLSSQDGADVLGIC